MTNQTVVHRGKFRICALALGAAVAAAAAEISQNGSAGAQPSVTATPATPPVDRVVIPANRSTVLKPALSGAGALGTENLMWSGLFLAADGAINFDAGDVVITHSPDMIAFTGASSGYGFDANLAVGIAPAPTVGMFFAGIVVGGTDSAALQVSPGFTPIDATSLYGIAVAPALLAGSATITNFINTRVEAVVNFGGNTVTNAYGLWVDEQTAGASKNRSIFVTGGQSDILGTVGIGTNSIPSTSLALAAGTTAKSTLNFAAGPAPRNPNNGDVWFDGTNLKMHVGGVTKTFMLTEVGQ